MLVGSLGNYGYDLHLLSLRVCYQSRFLCSNGHRDYDLHLPCSLRFAWLGLPYSMQFEPFVQLTERSLSQLFSLFSYFVIG
nr:MAG TPA: hypothetical protein [Caudoviricetes sp.]DAY34086.1 MAG TPA: hypothetical protein [Caudoviricetes sp.]